MIKTTLNNQGFSIEASYTQNELEKTYCPLLDKITQLRRDKGDRVIVYIAAPPGAGKTTLSLILEKIFYKKQTPFTLQAIAMDGFHHTNAYLSQQFTTIDGDRRPLKDFKGKPETFDLKGLKQALKALKTERSVEWPIYSRTLHDVAEKRQMVDADILLLEGNYLLLQQEGWKELKDYADFTISLSAPVALLKTRLIERKLTGGQSEESALAHYNRVDLPNHHLVTKHSIQADWELYLNEKEEWMKI